jgi:ribosomal protein S12 methylthiotransferase accessory factor
MASENVRQPIIVTHQGGVRFAAQVRSHRVFVDQPVHSGGDDTAPSPIELLGASLGTCIALYVKQFCLVRGLPYEGMRVEVETVAAANPNRIGRFIARVVLPIELPRQYADMIERVVRSCPAHNTLARGAEMTVSVETAARPDPYVLVETADSR